MEPRGQVSNGDAAGQGGRDSTQRSHMGGVNRQRAPGLSFSLRNTDKSLMILSCARILCCMPCGSCGVLRWPVTRLRRQLKAWEQWMNLALCSGTMSG